MLTTARGARVQWLLRRHAPSPRVPATTALELVVLRWKFTEFRPMGATHRGASYEPTLTYDEQFSDPPRVDAPPSGSSSPGWLRGPAIDGLRDRGPIVPVRRFAVSRRSPGRRCSVWANSVGFRAANASSRVLNWRIHPYRGFGSAFPATTRNVSSMSGGRSAARAPRCSRMLPYSRTRAANRNETSFAQRFGLNQGDDGASSSTIWCSSGAA